MDWMLVWTALAALSTAVYAIAATLTLVAIKRQGNLMQGQLQHMREQASIARDSLTEVQRQGLHLQASVEAAQEGATAAGVSAAAAKVSADSVINSERAWLLLEWAKPSDMATTLNFNFKNWGRTPAFPKELRRSYTIIQRASEEPKWPFDYDALERIPLFKTLPPNDMTTAREVLLNDNGRADSAAIGAVTSGQAAWRFMGVIRYGDIFGGERETRFCFDFQTMERSRGWVPPGDPEFNRCT